MSSTNDTFETFSKRLPSVNAIVDMLRKEAPNDLASIQSQYPEVELGPRLGAGTETVDPTVRDRRTAAQIELAIKGLEAGINACTRIVGRVQQRLRLASRVGLAGQVVSAIASASLLGLLTTAQPTFGGYLGASIALAGSLLGLGAQHFGGVAFAQSGSLYDHYRLIVEANVRAHRLLADLQLRAQFTTADDETLALVKEADAVCDRIRELDLYS